MINVLWPVVISGFWPHPACAKTKSSKVSSLLLLPNLSTGFFTHRLDPDLRRATDHEKKYQKQTKNWDALGESSPHQTRMLSVRPLFWGYLRCSASDPRNPQNTLKESQPGKTIRNTHIMASFWRWTLDGFWLSNDCYIYIYINILHNKVLHLGPTLVRQFKTLM